MLVFTQFLDVHFFDLAAQQKVGGKANGQRDGKFEAKHRQDADGGNALTDEDGEHFVGSGEEYCQQGARSDNVTCVKTCQRGGKSALRDETERAADGGACQPCAGDGVLHPFARLML